MSNDTKAPDALRPHDGSARRRKRFFLVRVSVLLSVLFIVVLFAVKDVQSRRERNAWRRTLDVAVVLVHPQDSAPLDPDALRGLSERIPALEEHLHAEAERHHPGIGPPFRIKMFGPIDVVAAPPKPESDGPIDLAKQAARLALWLHDVDPKAGVEPGFWDSRVYVSVRPPASAKRRFASGQSEQHGRVGTVDVEIDPSMIDLTLFVVTHELLHTIGATDKYDESGRTLIPDGLAEPSAVPLYPQRFAEVMSRNRPVSPTLEVIPESLDELAIGVMTAREIGWRD